MSRIGRCPSACHGVDVTINGRLVSVKGPKGQLTHSVAAPIESLRRTARCSSPAQRPTARALHG